MLNLSGGTISGDMFFNGSVGPGSGTIVEQPILVQVLEALKFHLIQVFLILILPIMKIY